MALIVTFLSVASAVSQLRRTRRTAQIAGIRSGAPGIGTALSAAYVWACGLVAITMLAGSATLGAVIGVAYVVQAGPTIWTATRTGAPVGVSRAPLVAPSGQRPCCGASTG